MSTLTKEQVGQLTPEQQEGFGDAGASPSSEASASFEAGEAFTNTPFHAGGWLGCDFWHARVITGCRHHFYFALAVWQRSFAARLFRHIDGWMLCWSYSRQMTMMQPNNSPEPTAVGVPQARDSTVAVHGTSRRWFSFFR